MTIFSGTIEGPVKGLTKRENQDSFSILEEKGFTVIAVSDGAGSLPQSFMGAQLASYTAVGETMDSLQTGTSFQEAVEKGIHCARQVLLLRDDSAKIGCTLAVAVVTEDEWALGIVGDSFAVVTKYNEESDELIHDYYSATKPSEFVNITRLLTSKDHSPEFFGGKEHIASVALSSDGLCHSSIKDDEPSPGFWTPIINMALKEELNVEDFLNHMKNSDRIEDDTTLVIAVNDQ